jgi:hypothetical protein
VAGARGHLSKKVQRVHHERALRLAWLATDRETA